MIEFVATLLNFVTETTAEIVQGLFDGLIAMFPPKRKTKYDSDFISPTEILAPSLKGFAVGRLNFPLDLSYRNFFIAGITGSGKSSTCIFNSLFSMDGNYVIHDPSFELYAGVAGFLCSRGFDIKVLNFSNPIDYFNPLALTNSSSEINKVASMIVRAMLPKTTDNFWNLQCTSLLSLFVSILKTQKPEYQNLVNVQRLINVFASKPESLDLLFVRSKNSYLLDEWKSFNGYEPKVLANIIATCKAALAFLNDEQVRRVISRDTVDIPNFRKKKCAIFIHNSVADQRYFSVLTSILFEQVFTALLKTLPQPTERDVFFLIDECPSLRIPSLPIAVTNLRKYRAGSLISVQSVSQLYENYSRHDADTIRANCYSKLYFTGSDLETSQELEAILGRFEFLDEEGQRRVMPLMTSDAIRTMDESHALLICGHHKPILLKNIKPYYKIARMRRYSKMPAPALTPEDSFTEIPLLPL